MRQDPNIQLDRRLTWQEAVDFVSLMKMRHGLLVERGEDVYAFAHLTFQEYLAAAHVKYEYAHDIKAMWALIRPHLHAPHWREVILLLLGSLNEFRKHPTELVGYIAKSADIYEDVLHRHLLLAARVLADRVEVDAKLRDEIVDNLLNIVRSDELARADAFGVLGLLEGNERAAAGLLALARDADVDARVRGDAARALGQFGLADEAVLSGLLTLARDADVDTWVRSAGIYRAGRRSSRDSAGVGVRRGRGRLGETRCGGSAGAVRACGGSGRFCWRWCGTRARKIGCEALPTETSRHC